MRQPGATGALSSVPLSREPVGPSGKAGNLKDLGFDSGSALLSLHESCGLWTLSCDFVSHD